VISPRNTTSEYIYDFPTVGKTSNNQALFATVSEFQMQYPIH